MVDTEEETAGAAGAAGVAENENTRGFLLTDNKFDAFVGDLDAFGDHANEGT